MAATLFKSLLIQKMHRATLEDWDIEKGASFDLLRWKLGD